MDLIQEGLGDWVHLGEVRQSVKEHHPGISEPELEDLTDGLIETLAREGIFEVGDLSGKGGRFVGWQLPLDEAITRIQDLFQASDNTFIWWSCWLNLTDRAKERLTDPRERTLLCGLHTDVALGWMQEFVVEHDRTAPLEQVQQQTLELIRSLVVDGLFELGDLSADLDHFVRCEKPLDEALAGIRAVYIDQYHDWLLWQYWCFLHLTDAGRQAAAAVEQKFENPFSY